MNWLFWLVLLIILVCCYSGYKKGFLKMAFSVVSVIVAMVVTTFLTPIVGNVMKNNNNIYGYFEKKVEKFMDFKNEELESDAEQKMFIDNLSIPISLKKSLLKNNTTEVYKERKITRFEDYIVKYITDLIINIISYVIVYIGVRLIILLLGKIFDMIGKMAIFSSINRKFGLLLGMIEGLLFVWIILALIFIFNGSAIGESSIKCINDSVFLKILYQNNLLINLCMIFL